MFLPDTDALGIQFQDHSNKTGKDTVINIGGEDTVKWNTDGATNTLMGLMV